MSIFWPSRHMFSELVTDRFGNTIIGDRNPYRFRVFSDTIAHQVREGDTLWSLAARYYQGFKRPAGLWWVIADFQPDPVFDPTIQLAVGSVIYVPSARVVETVILAGTRREEADP